MRDLLGVDTWAGLMGTIGRGDDVHRRTGDLVDRMLAEWVCAHLLPRPVLLPAPSAPPPRVMAATVLRMMVSPTTRRPADRVLLRDQYNTCTRS